MAPQPEVTRRAPRGNSGESTDAAQAGQSSTATLGGYRTGEPVPPWRGRRFVPREEFAALSRTAPDVCPDTFRADRERALP